MAKQFSCNISTFSWNSKTIGEVSIVVKKKKKKIFFGISKLILTKNGINDQQALSATRLM